MNNTWGVLGSVDLIINIDCEVRPVLKNCKVNSTKQQGYHRHLPSHLIWPVLWGWGLPTWWHQNFQKIFLEFALDLQPKMTLNSSVQANHSGRGGLKINLGVYWIRVFVFFNFCKAFLAFYFLLVSNLMASNIQVIWLCATWVLSNRLWFISWTWPLAELVRYYSQHTSFLWSWGRGCC